jgi:hypothetical protein
MDIVSLAVAIYTLSSKQMVKAGHGSSSYKTIKGINIKETGWILNSTDTPHANPMGCEKSDYIALSPTHLARDQILSLILSAYAMNKKVNFWITGCYESYGTSFPIGITASVSNDA